MRYTLLSGIAVEPLSWEFTVSSFCESPRSPSYAGCFAAWIPLLLILVHSLNWMESML